MTLLLNLIWLVFGGLIMAFAWAVAGCLVALTIIGLPWAASCFRIGGFTFWPFGRETIDRRLLTGREDIGTGPLGVVGNIVWLMTLGLPLALGHVAAAIACAVTIIGLPSRGSTSSWRCSACGRSAWRWWMWMSPRTRAGGRRLRHERCGRCRTGADVRADATRFVASA